MQRKILNLTEQWTNRYITELFLLPLYPQIGPGVLFWIALHNSAMTSETLRRYHLALAQGNHTVLASIKRTTICYDLIMNVIIYQGKVQSSRYTC
jgi:hypothetical protein